jgi:hypothetical protein
MDEEAPKPTKSISDPSKLSSDVVKDLTAPACE